MQIIRAAMMALLVSLGSVQSSSACVVFAGIDYQDIFQADLVVVGQVSNYRIVRPKNDKGRIIAEYARFDIRIREVVKAASTDAPLSGDSITVTWDNSTFSEPDAMYSLPQSPGFLIALRHPSSDLPPVRGPSAFIAPTPEPEHFTVFQAPCAQAFIFRMDSLVAIALRQWLTTDRDKDAEWEVLSAFLFETGAESLVERAPKRDRYTVP
jgi:hypothetical protein